MCCGTSGLLRSDVVRLGSMQVDGHMVVIVKTGC